MSKAHVWGLVGCLLSCSGCGGDSLQAGSNQTDGGAANNEPSQASAKLVFMSSERYSADLGGLSGADAKCQSLADAAGRTGEFRAWLSVISTPASARLSHSSVPYALSNGLVVANNWADLTRGTLRHAVDQTESSQLAPPNAAGGCNPLVFWTATDERGAQFGADCDGWTTTSADAPAQLGVISADSTWSTFCHDSCDVSAPIMCLEQ